MRNKRVLVVHYSQTGQLTQIARSLVAPLGSTSDVEVTWLELRPQTPYPFPWPFLRFMDHFPESVYLDPPPNEPVELAEWDYDLVLLCYQVWFLSPSLPITAFLQSPAAERLLRGKPVVTVIGCRNMWVVAHEKMQQLLANCGARLTDNVVFTDRGGFLTFYTTPRWLLTGKKGNAGVHEDDIRAAGRFGRALVRGLRAGAETRGEPMLSGLGAVQVDPKLAVSERMGHRGFRIWGRLIRALGPMGDPKRKPLLLLYSAFLITMIVTAVPVVSLLKALLQPLLRNQYGALQRRFEAPSGSGTERVAEFADA
jgi:hypothetical protein